MIYSLSLETFQNFHFSFSFPLTIFSFFIRSYTSNFLSNDLFPLPFHIQIGRVLSFQLFFLPFDQFSPFTPWQQFLECFFLSAQTTEQYFKICIKSYLKYFEGRLPFEIFLSVWICLDSIFTRTEHVSCHSSSVLGVVIQKVYALGKKNARKSMLMPVVPASEKDFLWYPNNGSLDSLPW